MIEDSDLQVLYIAFAGIWFANDLYAQLVPLLFTQLNIPSTILGISWSVVAIIQVTFSPLTGIIADEYDRMSVGAIACFGLAVLYTLFFVADSAIVIIIIMAFVGAFRLLVGNTATATISEALPDQISGIGWGLRDAFIYFGSAVGLATGGVLVGFYDDIRFAFLALIPSMIFVGALFAVRGSMTPSFTISISDIQFNLVSDIVDPIREISNWGILRKFIVVKIFVGFGMGGTMFLLPVFAVDIGINASDFLVIFAASHFIGILMSLIGGIAANIVSRKSLYVANFVVEAIMLLTFAITTNILFFGIAMSLFIIQTIFEPAVIGFFFDQFDEEEAGRAWSVDGLVSKGVSIIAPAVGGAVYAANPRLAFAGGGILTALAAIVAATIS